MIKAHKIVLIILDSLILMLSMILAISIKNELDNTFITLPDLISKYYDLFLTLPLISIPIFSINNLYKYNLIVNTKKLYKTLFRCIVYSQLLLLVFLFVFKYTLILERIIIFSNYFISMLFFVVLKCIIIPTFLRTTTAKKLINRKILILGAGELSRTLLSNIKNDEYGYYEPIGYLDDYITKKKINNLPILGKINQLDNVEIDFDEILISINNISFDKLIKIINLCKKYNKPTHIHSQKYSIIKNIYQLEQFDYFHTFSIFNHHNKSIVIKRILDIFGSLILIIILSPVLIGVALLIKITSKGPIFYKTTVIGYNKKSFIWYKFRTMKDKNDDFLHRNEVLKMAKGKKSGEKIKDDPRITPIGKFLRKFSIDELPQLYNCLKGQMSLVGPRPVLPYEFDLMNDWQKEKFAVKSGLTGVWQIYGRNNVGFDDQFVLDLYYVSNQSLWMDLELIVKTIPIVLFGKTGV